MSVKILQGPPAYNKAPSPAATPSKHLYPTSLMIEGEHPVWVSLPQPDKLHLSIRLDKGHFAPSYTPEDPQEYGSMITHALATGQAGPVLASKYIQHAGIYTMVQVAIGASKQPVYFTIQRTKGDPQGPHTLGIQMNPRLMGEEGIFELVERMHLVTNKRLLVGRMLAVARVSRLDIAVDVIGVDIADVLVRMEKQGKRTHTTGASGLQAIEIWREGIVKATATKRSVIVYDKRVERLEAGCIPPHDPAPVTRVEISKTRFGNKPKYLGELADLTSPFITVGVGHVRSAASPYSHAFALYVDARRAVGHARAVANSHLSPGKATKFDKWYSSHPSDIVDGKKVWQGWADGLQHTGTSLLIEAALQKSNAAPFPPDFSI